MNVQNQSITKLRLRGAAVLLVYFIALNSVCTQFIASRLAYHAALGTPLASTVYMPFAWLSWLFRFYRSAPTTFSYAFIIFALGLGAGLLAFVLYVGYASRSSRQHSDSHGTAHFATPDEVQETGLLPKPGKAGEGVYCGAWENPKTGTLHYLRHNGPEHVIALAPTRSGKGVGLVLPTLLSWSGSVFVLDRKGENYAITAGWREKHANNAVFRFDPAEPGSHRWNPLAEIRFRTRYQISDAQNTANIVVDSDGKGIEGDHFRSAAYKLLTGLILHALYKGLDLGRTPSLQDVAQMLTGVGDFAADEAEEDEDSDGDGDVRPMSGLFIEMRDVQITGDDTAKEVALVIAGAGRQMLNTPARELGSIISTANNALALYADPIVGENTSASDFTVSDLMNLDKPASLYFITTPRNSERMRPLARLLVTQMVLSLADRMEFDQGRAKTVHKHRLLLMLDEFPTLGKLDVFESALAYIAGYGMKAYIIAQDVQQLYKAYSNFESIISNCHVRAAYAPNKVETAEWLSKMTGVATYTKQDVSVSGKRFGALLENVSTHYSEHQRPLMTADEIMQLPGPKKDANGNILESGEMLVFVAGSPAIRGRQILYFKDPTFAERSKVPPPAPRVIVSPTTSPAGSTPAAAQPATGFTVT